MISFYIVHTAAELSFHRHIISVTMLIFAARNNNYII